MLHVCPVMHTLFWLEGLQAGGDSSEDLGVGEGMILERILGK